jgi:hypothetical protein
MLAMRAFAIYASNAGLEVNTPTFFEQLFSCFGEVPVCFDAQANACVLVCLPNAHTNASLHMHASKST